MTLKKILLTNLFLSFYFCFAKAMQEPTVWLIPQGNHAKHHREQPEEYQQRMGDWINQALETLEIRNRDHLLFPPGQEQDQNQGQVPGQEQDQNQRQVPGQEQNPGPEQEGPLKQNTNQGRSRSLPTHNGSDDDEDKNEKKKNIGYYNVRKDNSLKNASSPHSSGTSGSSSSGSNNSPYSSSYNPSSYNHPNSHNSNSYPNYNNNYSNAPSYDDYSSSGWKNEKRDHQENGEIGKKYITKRDILALDETHAPEMRDRPDPIKGLNEFF